MNPVFARFYDDYRRGLFVLAGFVVLSVLLSIISSRLTARLASVEEELASSERQATEAFLGYAKAWRKNVLLTTARTRVDALYGDIFLTTSQRFPAVDLGLKAIANKFSLAPETLAFNRTILNREQLEQLRVVLNVSGSYEDVRYFIAELESAHDDDGRDLFLSIEQVNLRDQTDSGAEIGVSVSVATYFHEPGIEVPGSGAGR